MCRLSLLPSDHFGMNSHRVSRPSLSRLPRMSKGTLTMSQRLLISGELCSRPSEQWPNLLLAMRATGHSGYGLAKSEGIRPHDATTLDGACPRALAARPTFAALDDDDDKRCGTEPERLADEAAGTGELAEVEEDDVGAGVVAPRAARLESTSVLNSRRPPDNRSRPRRRSELTDAEPGGPALPTPAIGGVCWRLLCEPSATSLAELDGADEDSGEGSDGEGGSLPLAMSSSRDMGLYRLVGYMLGEQAGP